MHWHLKCSLWQPLCPQPEVIDIKQPSALMEEQWALIRHLKILICARQKMKLNPGWPSTTAKKSQLKELSFSTDVTAVGIEPEMLTSVFLTSFQLLAARCFLAATSLAILQDLAMMANTLSYQVFNNT